MAQYRAIFQNAYFKGLATAAVLTAGLAVGQAQAGTNDENLEVDELTNATGQIEITGVSTDKGAQNKWGALTVSGAATTAIGQDLKISAGAKGDNYITTNDAADSVVTGKVLTIEVASNKVKDNGLTVKGTTKSGAAAVFTTANIKAGTLDINAKDSTQSGSFAANTINIGTATNAPKSTPTEPNAYVNLGAKATLGTALANNKLLSEMTTINLNKDGKIVALSGGSANLENSINAAVLNVNGGSMLIDATASGSGSDSTINLASGTMTDGTLSITSGSSLTIAFTDHLIKNTANDNVGLEKKFDINSGTIDAKGDITLTGKGAFTLADPEQLKITSESGKEAKFSVSGSAPETSTTLSLSKKALNNLTANTKLETNNAVLNITGNDEIILGTNKNLTFAQTLAAKDQILAGTGTTLKAVNVKVDGTVANAGSVTVDAKNLTLAGTAASTLAGLKAKDVTFVSSPYNQPYTLQDKLTLSSTTKVDNKIKATSGSFNSNVEGVLVSGGSAKLTIDGGIYAAYKIGVKKGSLTVSNNEADLSKLSIGTLALDNTSGANTITVSGTVSGDEQHEAVLDLSETTLSLTGHTSNKTSITVGPNGTLFVSGENLAKLINKEDAWGASNKGAGIYISGGEVDTLLTDIDAELSVDDLTSGSKVAENKIVFHESNGGTLNTQSLTLADTAGDGVLDIGGKATIDVGNTLSIKDDKSGDLVVKTGKIVVGEAINAATGSKSGTKLVLGKEGNGSATLQLGDIYFDEDTNKIEHTADTGAKVDVDLELAGKASNDTSKLTVKYGHWTAKDITAKNATIAIGSSDFEVKGAKDPQDHKFGLTANSLTLDAAATVTVDQNLEGSTQAQELVVGKLSTTEANAITLKGDMTLKGDDSVSGKFGLALKAKAISVEQGGSLTITDAALNAIKIDGTTVTIQDTAYADGALVSKTGSVVKLDFTSGTSLSDAALTELRQKLFGLSDTEKLKGTLNVGDAKIAGLPTVGSDGKVEWSDLAANKDVITDTTNNDLMNATVTGVTSTDPIRGSFGAVTSTQATDINNDERLTLNKSNQGYFAAQVDAKGNLVKDSNGNVVALGFTVAKDTDLTLNNGGKAGNITLGTNSGLVIGGKADGVTELTKVSGGNDASLDLLAGTLQVTNKNKKAEVSVGELSTAAGTTLKADKLTVSSTKVAEIKGNLDVTTKAIFKGETKLSGQNTLAAVDFDNTASITAGKTTVTGDLNVADTKKLSVIGGAALDVKTLKALGTGTEIFVGQSKDEPNGIDSTSGVLAADLFNLNGAYLVIDPEFGEASSFAGADIFGNDAQAEDAGIVHGNIYALQNAIASIGNKDEKEVKAKFAQFLDAKTGSLQKDGVGAIAYVAKNVKINDGSKIIVDPTATDKTYNATANTTEYNKGDLYLGNGAALAVDVSALADSTKAAITFNKTNADAVVYAKDSTKSAIYVTGSLADINKNAIKLFANTSSGQKVNLELGNTAVGETGKLTVQTINGLYAGSITEGDITSATVNLAFQTQKANQTFDVVSAPVKDTLLAAGAGFFDYDVAQSKEKVLGAVAEGITYDGTDYYYGEKKNDGSNKLVASKPADKAIIDKLANGTVVDGVVYYAPENELIENILVNGSNPIDAETNTRLAVFGGAPQAAIEAGASTYEAISARMGVGVSGVSAAANGQGGAIWVTPVYKSADADDFNADNKSYGADVKLYGLALGADIEVAPNFKVGGMFNVGSGDADGQGLGSHVSNDFDYYGLGLYAGYSMDAFSLVADVTYTAVDNDIEGNTDLGKVNASIDSTNLSVGVTGQYKLSLAGMDVTPHAGLRYSMIDMDDYSTAYSQNDSDSINIFSIPVGVTIAKEYVTDTWTVKPSFDLTLTGNFGDDEVDATAKWNGYSNLSTTVKSEIMDNFTYGAAVGVSATSGNFGLGLGINYTGSSNTDEFGVNANARYMF